MGILETTGLKKNFGKVEALRDVTLSVDEGEIFGFIGPNGAGKTTTIRVLLGMLHRDGGDARLFGQDAWKHAVELHKRVAYVPGDINLWDNLSGGEVIDLFIKLRKSNGASRRDEMIEKFGLDPTKKCRTYSKGNRQKVALVAAFALDAELYILDEPTSGLDPLMERLFKEQVRELKEEGKTIFLSSHILSEVEQLCDRVGIIRQGEIVETSSLAELHHMTQTRVLVETERALPDGLPGVAKREQQEDSSSEIAFLIEAGRIGDFITAVAPYGVKQLESTPPTLEELFMSRYEEGSSK